MNNVSCNTNNCSSCKSTSCKLSICPICSTKGRLVPNKTVVNLVKKDEYIDLVKESYICTNRNCNVIYYQVNNPNIYYKEDIKVPIFFKSAIKDYIVCYCHNITLLDICKIVNTIDSESITKNDVIKKLEININKANEDCITHNPLGENCDKVFNNAIQFAIKQKKKG